MAAITICSDFGAQKYKVSHCFHCFPIYLPWSDGTRWYCDLKENCCFLHFYLNGLLFLRLVLDSQQNRGEGAGSCHIPAAWMQALLPPPSASPPDGTFVTIDAPPLTHHYHAEVRVYTGFTLGVGCSLGLNKWMLTSVHHHSIIQKSFAALKSLGLCLFISLFILFAFLKGNVE